MKTLRPRHGHGYTHLKSCQQTNTRTHTLSYIVVLRLQPVDYSNLTHSSATAGIKSEQGDKVRRGAGEGCQTKRSKSTEPRRGGNRRWARDSLSGDEQTQEDILSVVLWVSFPLYLKDLYGGLSGRQSEKELRACVRQPPSSQRRPAGCCDVLCYCFRHCKTYQRHLGNLGYEHGFLPGALK